MFNPGSTITMMSKNLEAKLDQERLESRGSKILLLAAAAECSKRCSREMTSLYIPTAEGNVENNGFLEDKTLARKVENTHHSVNLRYSICEKLPDYRSSKDSLSRGIQSTN